MADKILYRINDETFVDSSDEEDGSDEDQCGDGDGDVNIYEDIDSCRDTNDVKRLEDLPWFHGGLTRNTAEAILLQNAEEGTYLLRCSHSSPEKFSVSVRCQDSVKHYTLEYDAYTKTYVFGNGQFDSLQELIDHFDCQPILSAESGPSITLKCGYMRNVEEPHSYVDVVRHTEGGSGFGGVDESLPDLQIASKEGYLVKRGAIHKNWKKRWFVLRKNLLKYFKRKDSSAPIRTLDLRHATEVCEDSIDDKDNCFRLCLPHRIFYFYATCPEERQQWMKILQWKVDYYTKGKGEDVST